ncbi:MFS transporter [Pseudonocardia nigra]|uniref:MFS transporter n=1 Tax=Pseudonocardia nigra TaxID=1921578 RepID=UPI001C5D9957|nr:MFS transporter [Pseudonocardia nigra]
MTVQSHPVAARRAAFGSFVGTTIEWYDFYVYATAASLVLGELFFPADTDRLTGVMASFAIFAVGFFARPLGGVVFGHFGDRVGRKAALVTTLLMMGSVTFAVGLLPTYSAIGVTAPILLVVFRFVQGLAVGGEWGGAALMAVEHAPAARKTFYGCFPQIGNSVGALLATGAFSLVSTLDDDALLSWGWRLPFLASAVLIVVGLVIRLRVEESPVFVAMRDEHARRQPAELPVKAALRTSMRAVLLGIGALPVAVGGYYIVTTFLLAYATGPEIGVSETTVLNALTAAAFLEVVATLVTSWLGDRVGPRRVVIGGLVAVALLAGPQFLVMPTQNTALIVTMILVMRIGMSGTYGPLPAILSAMFRPEVRYTGISLSYQVAGAIFGGLSPLVATALLNAYGGPLPVVGLLVLMCLVAIVCTVLAPQLADSPAAGTGAEPAPRPGVA